jgi:hypothetical protein
LLDRQLQQQYFGTTSTQRQRELAQGREPIDPRPSSHSASSGAFFPAGSIPAAARSYIVASARTRSWTTLFFECRGFESTSCLRQLDYGTSRFDVVRSAEYGDVSAHHVSHSQELKQAKVSRQVLACSLYVTLHARQLRKNARLCVSISGYREGDSNGTMVHFEVPRPTDPILHIQAWRPDRKMWPWWFIPR